MRRHDLPLAAGDDDATPTEPRATGSAYDALCGGTRRTMATAW
jgi:hypothetical protein